MTRTLPDADVTKFAAVALAGITREYPNKPGHVLNDGPGLTGELTVADIGLDPGVPTTHLVEPVDVAAWLPRRSPAAHKWDDAVRVVAGSTGMTGAAHLAAQHRVHRCQPSARRR